VHDERFRSDLRCSYGMRRSAAAFVWVL
jgi:hypothetical protein